jgi:hypothetical protein
MVVHQDACAIVPEQDGMDMETLPQGLGMAIHGLVPLLSGQERHRPGGLLDDSQ